MCRCLDAQVGCCCGPSPCRLCCRCMPWMRESVSTRLMYTLILFVAAVACCLMQSSRFLEHLVNLPSFNETCLTLKLGENCENLVGYLAVYRVCFCMVVFHFFMWLLTLCISTSNSWRAGIHNGYWFIKIFILLGMCIGSFYVPTHYLYTSGVGQVWMYVGMAGAGIFIVLQLVLLVSFAYTWHIRWKGRAKANGSRCWYFALYLCAVTLFMVAIAGAIFLFLYFTRLQGCILNKIFIGTNVGACFLLSLISYLPCTRKVNPNSGLLQSALISVYVLYLTWTALTSEPHETMTGPAAVQYRAAYMPTPDRAHVTMPTNVERIHESVLNASRTAINASGANLLDINSIQVPCGPELLKSTRMFTAYIGAVIMFGMVVFSSLRTTQQADQLGIRPAASSQRKSICCCCCTRNRDSHDDSGGQVIIHDEMEGVQYSYAFFHFIFMLASLYIMVQLTEWYMPEDSALHRFNLNWPSVWVKMASSWVCIIVYAITLFTPGCWPQRDISNIPMGSLPRRRDKAGTSADTYV